LSRDSCLSLSSSFNLFIRNRPPSSSTSMLSSPWLSSLPTSRLKVFWPLIIFSLSLNPSSGSLSFLPRSASFFLAASSSRPQRCLASHRLRVQCSMDATWPRQLDAMASLDETRWDRRKDSSRGCEGLRGGKNRGIRVMVTHKKNPSKYRKIMT
jgi:hypothetical protein